MGDPKIRTYCRDCKVVFIDGACFCNWDGEKSIAYPGDTDSTHIREEERKADEFKEKIRSISFNRVKGGGRG